MATRRTAIDLADSDSDSLYSSDDARVPLSYSSGSAQGRMGDCERALPVTVHTSNSQFAAHARALQQARYAQECAAYDQQVQAQAREAQALARVAEDQARAAQGRASQTRAAATASALRLDQASAQARAAQHARVLAQAHAVQRPQVYSQAYAQQQARALHPQQQFNGAAAYVNQGRYSVPGPGPTPASTQLACVTAGIAEMQPTLPAQPRVIIERADLEECKRVLRCFPVAMRRQVLTDIARISPHAQLTPSILRTYLVQLRQICTQQAASRFSSLPAASYANESSIEHVQGIQGTASALTIRPPHVEAVNAHNSAIPNYPELAFSTGNQRASGSVYDDVKDEPNDPELQCDSQNSSIGTADLLQQVAEYMTSAEQEAQTECDPVTPLAVPASQSAVSTANPVNISPVKKPAEMSSQTTSFLQSLQQTRSRETEDTEDLKQLQEAKRQKLVFDNLRLSLELGVITCSECIEQGHYVTETWK